MAAMGVPRLPKNDDRITIIGVTGSGKTLAGLWHLSRRNLEKFPWVIIDFKNDEHIAGIENIQEIGLNESIPKKANGVFVLRPLPHQKQEVEDFLWKIWERENVGVYVDEGFMVDNPAMDAILTQGRSKHVPVIMLAQRPVWLSRFVFSEASFFQIFALADKRDEETVAKFTRNKIDFSKPLPDYHSSYYDVGKRSLYRFSPVPSESEILETINAKLAIKRKRI
jgi:hypothetical protein